MGIIPPNVLGEHLLNRIFAAFHAYAITAKADATSKFPIQNDWADTDYEAALQGLEYFVPEIHYNSGEQHVDRFYAADGEEY